MKKFNVAYFTASCDKASVNADFAKSLKLDYPILSDPGRATAKAYGVVTATRKFPHRWTFYIGTDGKVLHVDKQVNSGSHGKDIAAKLKELGVKSK